jgi:hypothetical protein
LVLSTTLSALWHSELSALYITEGEAIKTGVELLFFGTSDAAFANKLKMHRSLHGLVFKLYGMPIDWKATVRAQSQSQLQKQS